jgi:hypothetical protein
MSVKGHRVEGNQLVVTLRGGGEMTLDRSLIVRIGPDEVPYEDPILINERASGARQTATFTVPRPRE